MADKVSLGRVQGVGFFYTSATCTSTTTTIVLSSIVPSDVTVFVGDKVLCSTGEVFTVASVNSSNLTVIYVASLKGDKGDKGDTATIDVGTVATLTPGDDAYVKNVGTSTSGVFDFGIPRGDKGETGKAATIEVGEVETLEPDKDAYITNVGDTIDAKFNFGIPRGEPGTSFEISYQVDLVSDLPTPTKELLGKAYAVGKESPHDIYVVAIDSDAGDYYWLNLGQLQGPTGDKGDKGDKGNAATIEVGEVETLEPDKDAYVNNSGDTYNAVFDFGIPRGETGAKGDTGLTPDISATANIDQTIGTAIVTVDRSGSNEEPLLDFRFSGIKGETGETGKAATIEVGEVETLEPDKDAYITNVGDTIDAKFNFGIPRGVGIVGAHIDEENNLTFDLSNGETISAGKIIPATSIYLAVARDNSTGLIQDFGVLYNGIVTINNLQYKLIAEHELCVTAYLSTSNTTVTIPDTIEIYTLSNYDDQYTIDEFSVVSIESNVFQNHAELTTVTISSSVCSIGDYCFDGCTKLTTISFGSVTSIPFDAFRNCSSLKSVVLPNTCTELHAGCFAECTSLTSITLPDSLLTIGSTNDTVYPGFSNTSITSLTIPVNVTSIIEGFFGAMPSLSTVIYNARNAELSTYSSLVSGGIFFTNNAYGTDASNLSITFGTTVQTIGAYMFADTNKFVSITFNSGCTSIGEHAFDCSYLFRYPSTVCSLTLPNTLLTIGDSAFTQCAVFNSIIIPDSVISVGASAFYYTGYNVTQAIEIRLGKSVSSIGSNCFYAYDSSKYPLTIGFYNSGSFTIDSGAFDVPSTAYIGTITVNYVGSASDWSSKVSGSGMSGRMLTAATWNYNVNS